jgi:hypothetical protein
VLITGAVAVSAVKVVPHPLVMNIPAARIMKVINRITAM